MMANAAVSPSFLWLPSVHPRRTPRCDWLKWDHFLPEPMAGQGLLKMVQRLSSQSSPTEMIFPALLHLKYLNFNIFKLLTPHTPPSYIAYRRVFRLSPHHPSSPARLQPKGPPKISTTCQLAGDIHTSFLEGHGHGTKSGRAWCHWCGKLHGSLWDMRIPHVPKAGHGSEYIILVYM